MGKSTSISPVLPHGQVDLTLSMMPHLYHQVIDVEGIRMAVNYGLNKLRFPSPVPVGKRVRVGLELVAVDDIKGGVQCTFQAAIEVEGGDKPAMAAEVLYRYYL